jgi:hypothetical protein
MKEPHNYRKVGYSMIVISVSLTIIGLVAWSIGNDYHFGTGLMAGQEIDAMTPKQGYNIISFDYAAPVGSKLKLLDHTDSISEAKKLQDQYQQSAKGFQFIIFVNSRDSNVDLMAHAEVAAFTPIRGYNVIFFNHAMPVGAKLAMNAHTDLLVNATADEQKQQEENKDPDVSVIILSSSYADNLKTVLGSGSSTGGVNVQPVTPSTPSATLSNIPPVTNTSAATLNNDNKSMITAEKLTTTANVNQTTTNGTNISVNLNESIGVTSK